MLLTTLIKNYASLNKLISELERNIDIRKKSRSPFRQNLKTALYQTDDQGTSGFHQLIEHPEMNADLFNRLITVLEASKMSPLDLENFERSLLIPNKKKVSCAMALSSNPTLLKSLEGQWMSTNQQHAIKSGVFKAIVLTIAQEVSPFEALIQHALTIPALYQEMLTFIQNTEECDSVYRSIITSLQTPNQAMAATLYAQINTDLDTFNELLNFLNTNRYGPDHVEGLASLLAQPVNETKTGYAAILKHRDHEQYKDALTSHLLALTTLNPSAGELIIQNYPPLEQTKRRSIAVYQPKILTIFCKYLNLIPADQVDTQIKDLIRQQASEGLCFGYAICYGAFNLFSKRPWWNHLLATIAQWDGSLDQLETSHVLVGSDGPQTLKQLIERAMYYVVCTQGINFNTAQVKFLGEKNAQLQYLYETNAPANTFQFAIDIKNSSGNFETKTIQSMDDISCCFSDEQLIRLLDDNKELTHHNLAIILGPRHACIIDYNPTIACWLFYDSNSRTGDQFFQTTADLVAHITRCKTLGRQLEFRIASFERPDIQINLSGLTQDPTLFLDESLQKLLVNPQNFSKLFTNCTTPASKMHLAKALIAINPNALMGIKVIVTTLKPATIESLLNVIASDNVAGKVARINLASTLNYRNTDNQSFIRVLCTGDPKILSIFSTFIKQDPEAAAIASQKIAEIILDNYEKHHPWHMHQKQLTLFLPDPSIIKPNTLLEESQPKQPRFMTLLIRDLLERTTAIPTTIRDSIRTILYSPKHDKLLLACLALMQHREILAKEMPLFLGALFDFIEHQANITPTTAMSIGRQLLLTFRDENLLPTKQPTSSRLHPQLMAIVQSQTDSELEQITLTLMQEVPALIINHWRIIERLLTTLNETSPIIVQKSIICSLENLAQLDSNTKHQILAIGFNEHDNGADSLKRTLIKTLLTNHANSGKAKLCLLKSEQAPFAEALVALVNDKQQPIKLLTQHFDAIIEAIPEILPALLGTCQNEPKAIQKLLLQSFESLNKLDVNTITQLVDYGFEGTHAPLQLELINLLFNKENRWTVIKLSELNTKNPCFAKALIALLENTLQPIDLLTKHFDAISTELPEILPALLTTCQNEPKAIQKLLLQSFESLNKLNVDTIKQLVNYGFKGTHAPLQLELIQLLFNKSHEWSLVKLSKLNTKDSRFANALIALLENTLQPIDLLTTQLPAIITELPEILPDLLLATQDNPVTRRKALLPLLSTFKQLPETLQTTIKPMFKIETAAPLTIIQTKLIDCILNQSYGYDELLRLPVLKPLLEATDENNETTLSLLLDLSLNLMIAPQTLLLSYVSRELSIKLEILPFLDAHPSFHHEPSQRVHRLELLHILLESQTIADNINRLKEDTGAFVPLLLGYLQHGDKRATELFLQFIGDNLGTIYEPHGTNATLFAIIYSISPKLLLVLLNRLESEPELSHRVRISLEKHLHVRDEINGDRELTLLERLQERKLGQDCLRFLQMEAPKPMPSYRFFAPAPSKETTETITPETPSPSTS